ncbi:hypothetical protein QYF36_000766 [Acer negundo]|nr:hypothetical protein QYF36_000766 [Acer negundo]
MSQEFEISLVGELSYFLGLQIRQLNAGIFITQAKYAKNLVKKFGLEKVKHCDTPMSTTLKLSKDASGKSVEQTLYHGMIGSLLYLTTSRPDISFSVGVDVCARYQADPKESHLSSVKRIIRYVNGTYNYGIWYSFDTNASLVGFSDADWAENCDDRKSTSGGCFFLGNNLVSWFCKKQNSISLSTAEVEYIAAGSGCTQLLWMKQMLVDYGFNQGALHTTSVWWLEQIALDRSTFAIRRAVPLVDLFIAHIPPFRRTTNSGCRAALKIPRASALVRLISALRVERS